MTHAELIGLLLTAHGGVLGVSLILFYSYSDRTDGFAGSLKGISTVQAGMGRRMVAELSNTLEPVFESPGSVPSPVLGPDGEAYSEHAVNPIGSEAFREALRDFVEENSVPLAEYRSLMAASNSWCFWTNKLSWFVLSLLIWQIVATAVTFLDKLTAVTLPTYVNVALWVPTVGLGLACLLAVLGRFLYYTRITRFRMKYGEL